MNISPNEIELIEEAGMLNQKSVKLLKTKGGFWIAVGSPNGKNDEAMAAGSHPAIVKYNLEKKFPGFQPILVKSEFAADQSVVQKFTHYLSDDLKKTGHDIYSVQNGINIEFQITKQDVKIGSVKASLEKGEMLVKEMNISNEFSKALAGATAEKAILSGASKVRIQGK